VWIQSRRAAERPGYGPGFQDSKGHLRGGKSEVGTMVLFLRFFEVFRSDFRKYFSSVFELLVQRNGPKCD
jgi:hypothetical protein